MARQKLSISDLKIESCVTALSEGQLNQVKGGAALVKGKKLIYQVHWTAVDTRVQPDGVNQVAPPIPDRQ